MKLQWLIETEVFEDDCLPFIEALKELGVGYVASKFGVTYQTYIDLFKDARHAIFHGSFQFAKAIQDARHAIFHGSFQFAKAIQDAENIKVYCNLPKYACLFYYPRFGKYLLNADCIMLPFGEISRRKKWITEHIAHKVFVRPSSAAKVFTGTVLSDTSLVDTWDMPSAWRFIDPQELTVIAPAVNLVKEWRTIVIKNRIVASCQYKELDKVVRIKEAPDKVLAYGQDVLDSVKYKPEDAWVMDICEDSSGQLKVLEVGSFSCSGFYACDPYAIISAMETL